MEARKVERVSVWTLTRVAAVCPPAVTLVSLLMIGALFGPLGVILGGPLTVAIFITVRELWVLRVMGHDDIVPDDTPG